MTNSTNFVDQVTVIQANWCNDVNTAVFANRYDVVNYGADASGATDSTTAINAAITACNAAGGGIVFLPVGTYRINSTVTLLGNVSLVGAGSKATFLRTTSATANIVNVTGSHTRIANIGFKTTVTRTAGAYISADSEYCYINDFYMSAPYIGIQVTGLFTWVNVGLIEDIVDRSTATGSTSFKINVAGEADLYIDNVICRMSTAVTATYPSYCVQWINGQVVHISNCEFLQADIGLSITPTTGALCLAGKFSNVYFDNCLSDCAIIQPSGTGTVVDMNFNSAWFGALGGNGASIVQGGSTNVDLIKFTGCSAENYTTNTGTGLYVSTTSGYELNLTVNGCSFGRQNLAFIDGIAITGGTKNFSIMNTDCMWNATGVGIHVVTAASDDYCIIGNRVTHNNTAITDSGTGIVKFVASNVGA